GRLKRGDDLPEFANPYPGYRRNESCDFFLRFPLVCHRYQLDPFSACGLGKNQGETTVPGNQTKAWHAKANSGEFGFPFRVGMPTGTADAALRAGDELCKMRHLRTRGRFLTDPCQRVFERQSLSKKGAVGLFDCG